MQEWKKFLGGARHYDVLLFPGFSNQCLSNTVEPLRAANDISGRRLYSWRFTSIPGGVVHSSSGLPVGTDALFDGAEGDMLLALPSYDFLAHANPDTGRALRRAARSYPVLAGLDTGSWLMAAAGLLDDYEATIHWEEFETFAETFAQVRPVRARFVIDRDRITCSGASAAFDMVLSLITQDHGAALGLEIAQIFLMRTPESGGFITRSTGDRLINRAMAVMQEHLEDPLPLARIAQHAGCSQKTLAARIKAELGTTPGHLYRRLRLALARKLLRETQLGIAEVAVRCGYDDASAMTRAFRGEFGQTPRETRRRFQQNVG